MAMSKSKQLTSEVDEYLCHRRFFHLSLKFGDTSSVVCEPYKASWLISHYQNYELKRQERVNEWREVMVKFREYCILALTEENIMLRHQEETGETVFPDITDGKKVPKTTEQ